MSRYEYRVRSVHGGPPGNRLWDEQLETILNREAADGWRLSCMAATPVAPDGRAGLILTLERPVDPAAH